VATTSAAPDARVSTPNQRSAELVPVAGIAVPGDAAVDVGSAAAAGATVVVVVGGTGRHDSSPGV
jgi:hypothetical protein